MKLNAICVVKNEADIIMETLNNALRFCDNIYIFDNHSTDGTWELVSELAQKDSRVIIAERSAEVYKNQLRNRVYNRYNQQFSTDDWWYIVDADEIVLEDPRPMLRDAKIATGCEFGRLSFISPTKICRIMKAKINFSL